LLVKTWNKGLKRCSLGMRARLRESMILFLSMSKITTRKLRL
jgi:hypothetical protein